MLFWNLRFVFLCLLLYHGLVVFFWPWTASSTWAVNFPSLDGAVSCLVGSPKLSRSFPPLCNEVPRPSAEEALRRCPQCCLSGAFFSHELGVTPSHSSHLPAYLKRGSFRPCCRLRPIFSEKAQFLGFHYPQNRARERGELTFDQLGHNVLKILRIWFGMV